MIFLHICSISSLFYRSQFKFYISIVLEQPLGSWILGFLGFRGLNLFNKSDLTTTKEGICPIWKTLSYSDPICDEAFEGDEI